MKKAFKIFEVLETSKRLLQENWKHLVPTMVFVALFSAIASMGIDPLGPFGIEIGPDVFRNSYMVFGVLAYVLITAVITVGVLQIFLAVVHGKKDIQNNLVGSVSFETLISLIGTYILYLLALIIGFILLIIPGIFLSIALSPVFYIVVDQKIGPAEAFKKALAITKGNWWRIVGLSVMSGLIILAVIILCFLVGGGLIGALWATGFMPLVMIVGVIAAVALLFIMFLLQAYMSLVGAVMYKRLNEANNGTSVSEEETTTEEVIEVEEK